MAKHLLEIAESNQITEVFLAEGEFLLGISLAYDNLKGSQAIANAGVTEIGFQYNTYSYEEVPTVYAGYAMYTDSAASTTCVVTVVTGSEGFIPFPLVGKVCGPMRVNLITDAPMSGGTGYIEAFTNKG